MYRTQEGGFAKFNAGSVSLDWVNENQNSWVGIQYGVIAKRIRTGKTKDQKVVVVTTTSLPTLGIPANK